MNQRTHVFSGPIGFPRDDRGHYLVVVEGPDQGRRWELASEPLNVGRGVDNEIHLTDPGVSTRHCRLTRRASGTLVEDLGSTNGTFLSSFRLEGIQPLPAGALLRLGNSVLHYELRDRAEVEQLEELERAARQIRSLLPAPLDSGPVRAEWRFWPSIGLGGDAFGYHWVDDDHFSVYLLDVCGHGIGACLHATSALNALRSGTLPVDWTQPNEVATALNRAFDMEKHAGLYFSLWLGVYERPSRSLRFVSAGHPPALYRSRVSPSFTALKTPNLALGIAQEFEFRQDEQPIQPGDRLYVFSDGAFEIVKPDGSRGSLNDLKQILERSSPEKADEPGRVERSLRKLAQDSQLDDDFSLVVLTFE